MIRIPPIALREGEMLRIERGEGIALRVQAELGRLHAAILFPEGAGDQLLAQEQPAEIAELIRQDLDQGLRADAKRRAIELLPAGDVGEPSCPSCSQAVPIERLLQADDRWVCLGCSSRLLIARLTGRRVGLVLCADPVQ